MMSIVKRHLPLILLLVLSAFIHGYNMFHFPYYENDEGVYMSQAWSVLEEGKLAPYTYWYDHAPAGWFLISIWVSLTGGIFTFGTSIDSGRVLILLLHVISTFFIYFIIRRTTKRELPALIAGLVFALSPLGIYFGRRVLLDNIMTFWILLSLVLIVKRHPSIWRFFFSGICFGIAILTKESAIFFAPAFLFLALVVSDKHIRIFSTAAAVLSSAIIVSLYPLFALIKGEFFEYGSLFGGSSPHVSLIETLKFQGSRPGGSFFTPNDSAFWTNYLTWLEYDPLLIGGGTIATFFIVFAGLFMWKRQPFVLGSALLSLLYLFFLVRGGVVIEFYVIPLVFLFSLTIGFAAYAFTEAVAFIIREQTFTRSIHLLVCLGIAIFYFTSGLTYLGMNVLAADQTKPQLEALEWIRENASSDDVIVIHNYTWIDLNAPNNPGGMHFENAEWYWKVEKDTEIQEDMLQKDYRNIDYVMVTPQMKTDADGSGFLFIPEILRHSQPITAFNNDKWGVEIWGVRTPQNILERSWRYYKKTFVVGGAVVDPQQNNRVTSLNQSYTLLRAVWMDDRETFDSILAWTEENLKKNNGLFASTYEQRRVVETKSRTDADQTIALAFIFASSLWQEEEYLTKAREVLSAIRNHSVSSSGGAVYLSAGDWAVQENEIIFNPSYLQPAWYRIFDEVDPSGAWSDLIVPSSYDVLEACTFNLREELADRLPPDWCALERATGEFRPPEEPDPVSITYSHDAFRIPMNLAFDYQWFGSEEAEGYLNRLAVLGDEWEARGELATTYTHEGFPFERYESVASYAGNLGYFLVTDPVAAEEIFEQKISEKFFEDSTSSYWEDSKNPYTQNMAWFATGQFGSILKNLYE